MDGRQKQQPQGTISKQANVLGADAEGPADDIQDFLHGDRHGSPKLRAEHEPQAAGQSRESLPEPEKDMGVPIL